MMPRFCLLLFLLGVRTAAVAGLTPAELKAMPATELEAALPGEHPSSYYVYAGRLFSEGKKDEAVRWFYIGQLRYRIHLKAHAGLEPSGDPALFASLNATLGQQINLYAGGDPVRWAALIGEALRWDAEQVNTFTPKSKFPAAHAEMRAGLVALAKQIEDGAATIREERKKRGLENRGPGR